MTEDYPERLEREHRVAVEALRAIRDSSLGHADAIQIAKDALRDCGVVPEPTFDSEIADFLAEQRSLAAGEAVTQRMLMGPTPQGLLDDLRCASCERQDREGYPGLCDGCLDALGDAA